MPFYISSGTSYASAQKGKLSCFSGFSVRKSKKDLTPIINLLNTNYPKFVDKLLNFTNEKVIGTKKKYSDLEDMINDMYLISWFIKFSPSFFNNKSDFPYYKLNNYDINWPGYFNNKNEIDVFRFLGGEDFKDMKLTKINNAKQKYDLSNIHYEAIKEYYENNPELNIQDIIDKKYINREPFITIFKSAPEKYFPLLKLSEKSEKKIKK